MEQAGEPIAHLLVRGLGQIRQVRRSQEPVLRDKPDKRDVTFGQLKRIGSLAYEASLASREHCLRNGAWWHGNYAPINRAIFVSTVARSRPKRTRLLVMRRCGRWFTGFGGGNISRNVAPLGVSSARNRIQAA